MDATYCPHCGKDVTIERVATYSAPMPFCVYCGEQNRMLYKFCTECGAKRVTLFAAGFIKPKIQTKQQEKQDIDT